MDFGRILIYDPKGNVFAVASKAGAPRTMFKPDDGMDYWAEQKAREAKRQQASADRKSRDDEAGSASYTSISAMPAGTPSRAGETSAV